MKNTGPDLFLLERLYRNSKLPVYIYEKGKEGISIPAIDKVNRLYQNDKMLLDELISCADKKTLPCIYMEEIKIFHGVFTDGDGRYYIWGPAALEELTKVHLASYKHRHNVGDSHFQIQKSTYEILSNIMSIAYLYLCQKQVQEEDILIDWGEEEERYEANPGEMERYQLDKSEINRIHNSIEYENRYVAAVEQGDVTVMKKLMQINSLDVEGIGVVAENALKQMEYLCVSSVMLVSRAAIRGGLNPEYAHDLSDVYLQKLEKCHMSHQERYFSAKRTLITSK